MKVKTLIKKLQKFPPNYRVLSTHYKHITGVSLSGCTFDGKSRSEQNGEIMLRFQPRLVRIE